MPANTKRLLLLVALLSSACTPYDGRRAYLRDDLDGKCYEYTEPFGIGRLEWREVPSVYCPGTLLIVGKGTV